jgi:sugar phosphate isomerase/epimerase
MPGAPVDVPNSDPYLFAMATENVDPGTGPAIGRRAFLATACAGLGTAAVGRAAGGSSLLAQSRQPIGLQLYTVRDLMDRDVEYTLRQVAAVGYREVEFAGLFDEEPRKVASMLQKVGLTSPASHISLARLRSNLSAVVDEAQALGNRYVVCPSIDAGLRRDADGWRRIAADFDRIGESLQRVGLRFAYHNHDYEFKPLPGGEIGFDLLVAGTDPRFVKIEMDLFWITKGGRDPLEYFARWPNRFPMVHVKDMTGGGTMTNVGQGHIDWGRIFAKRREAGIEHFFVEHDSPRSPMADIQASFDYMVRLGL